MLYKILPFIKDRFSKQRRRVSIFNKNNGSELRYKYDLHDKSLVFDLGGYEGQWASDIFGRYLCEIHVFEPFLVYAYKIEERFSQNKSIIVHGFGLASATQNSFLSISADSSSAFKKAKNNTEIKLIRASDFISDNNINFIDLMKINIEGGEFDLLEHLIETGIIIKIKNIQVQFHDFFPEARRRMKSIQNNLIKTHSLTFQYEFVWENWQLK